MPDLTLAERVSTSFSKLTSIATGLNAVSDELGKSVAQVDSALKNLNIGIPVWVPIKGRDGGEMEDYEYWSEDLGYSKINGKWGISIRRVEGNHRRPDRETREEWLFGDAPRALRLEAVDKIPDLLEKLSEQAAFAIQKIHAKLADVQALAAAVNPPKPKGFVVKGTSASKMPQPDGMSAESIYLRPVEPFLNTVAKETDYLRQVEQISKAVAKKIEMGEASWRRAAEGVAEAADRASTLELLGRPIPEAKK